MCHIELLLYLSTNFTFEQFLELFYETDYSHNWFRKIFLGYDAQNFAVENKILSLSIDAVHSSTNSKITINSSILAPQKGQHEVEILKRFVQ